MATIEDVARRAQVSVATVSRALRGLPNVAAPTRARVLRAAHELHYVADPSASRLATGRYLTIGLVVPTIGQWFYSVLFTAVESVVAAADYDLQPFTMSGPGGVAGFVEALPFRKRVDGLLVVDAPLDDAQRARLGQAHVPMVTIGLETGHAPAILVDNVSAARLAVTHLTALGHDRVALIGGGPDDPNHFRVPVERHEGYQQGLRAAGIEPDPRLTIPCDVGYRAGAEAMHRLLALDDPPTAVFACSDEAAIGAMQAIRDAGLRIPEDVSVVGFDDHDAAAYLGLTTVRQDVRALGEHAARLLLGEVAAPTGETGRDRHPTRLIVRQTTGPPPAGTAFRW